MSETIYKHREILVETLYNEIIYNPSNVYMFIGKHGTGKKYVIDQVEMHLKKDFKIYHLIEDTFYEYKKKVPKYIWNISFSLECYAGISLNPVKNDSTKVNYIISNLKSSTHFFKKNIIISAVNFDILQPESRDFLTILVNNKNFIEEKIRRKITVIITGCQDYFPSSHNTKKIYFKDYELFDLKEHLITKFNYIDEHIDKSLLQQLFNLCGTNLNLVNCYHEYILSSNKCSDLSIDSIVQHKLNYYYNLGKRFNLANEDLKDLLLTSSMSIHLFDKNIIQHVTNKNNDEVTSCFKCAEDEYFLKKIFDNSEVAFRDYKFISQDIKNHLAKIAFADYKNKVLEFYDYLSLYNEDEYFERAQYIYNYYGTINNVVFSLLILALSKSFTYHDTVGKHNINDFLSNSKGFDVYRDLFEKIYSAYENHVLKNYKESNTILSCLDYSSLGNTISAELKRLIFRNGQLGYCVPKEDMLLISKQLYTYVDKQLYIDNDLPYRHKDEKILTLRIIFDVAPYILDDINDAEKFQELYNKGLVIAKFIDEHFIKKGFAQYIINVFNRKAFLFAEPAVALLYYEQAKGYFESNHFIDQLAITLSGRAGMYISLRKYKDAIRDCQEAISLINKNNIHIPQQEKIYNNLYIAQFLNKETCCTSFKEVQEYAKYTIRKLEKLLTGESSGKEHVILTNLASLSLYTNRERKYLKVKACLETSLQCKDVSNIYDTSINDFYRYHFAWYEFYRVLSQRDWVKSAEVLQGLDGFYPALFKSHGTMDARVKAANLLLNKQECPTALDFCMNFTKNLSNLNGVYDSRGLLLSDLQFTSWD